MIIYFLERLSFSNQIDRTDICALANEFLSTETKSIQTSMPEDTHQYEECNKIINIENSKKDLKTQKKLNVEN